MGLVHMRPAFNEFGEPVWLLPSNEHTDRAANQLLRSTRTLNQTAKVWEIDHDEEETVCDLVEAELKNEDCWCSRCNVGEPCGQWTKILKTSPKAFETYRDRDPEELGRREARESAHYGRTLFSDEEIAAMMDHAFNFLFGMFGGARFVGATAPAEDVMTVEQAASVLKITWPCTKEQVAVAFKEQAKVSHPDRGGTDEAMRNVLKAREVLWARLGVQP